MALFGKKKADTCCCTDNCTPDKMAQSEKTKSSGSYVKVLGPGCPKCHALAEAAQAALNELGLDTTVEHVGDFAKIAVYGVMTTPALVIGNKVVAVGKTLNKNDIITLIKQQEEQQK